MTNKAFINFTDAVNCANPGHERVFHLVMNIKFGFLLLKK